MKSALDDVVGDWISFKSQTNVELPSVNESHEILKLGPVSGFANPQEIFKWIFEISDSCTVFKKHSWVNFLTIRKKTGGFHFLFYQCPGQELLPPYEWLACQSTMLITIRWSIEYCYHWPTFCQQVCWLERARLSNRPIFLWHAHSERGAGRSILFSSLYFIDCILSLTKHFHNSFFFQGQYSSH